jgi:hypothetical protein
MNNQQSTNNPQPPEGFGPVIYSYTRSQAVADGLQVEVSKMAREAGPRSAKRFQYLGHLSSGGLGESITYPVFLTRAVFDTYVTVPPNVTAQDDHVPRSGLKTWGNHLVADLGSQPGRLWDIVWMTRFAIIRMRSGRNAPRNGGPSGTDRRLPVALYVRNNPQAAQLVKLIAVCGPLDIDDPQPAITVMMPDED